MTPIYRRHKRSLTCLVLMLFGCLHCDGVTDSDAHKLAAEQKAWEVEKEGFAVEGLAVDAEGMAATQRGDR